jgi:hypothetical protein
MQSWWGEFELDSGEVRFWRIGPLELWLERQAGTWQVSYRRRGGAMESAIEVASPGVPLPDDARASGGADLVTTRHGFGRTAASVRLEPRAADRALVVDPARPFVLAPGEQVTVFVSLPLWLRITVGDRHVELDELPIHRPSDTWFGPSTRIGELCYAVRTSARLALDELPRRPHRAIAVVRIQNRASTRLPLARLRVPAPLLSIYGAAGGHLWTEALTLERQEDGEVAAVRLGDGPPPEATGVRRLGEARRRAARGLLESSFGGLFGRLRGEEMP